MSGFNIRKFSLSSAVLFGMKGSFNRGGNGNYWYMYGTVKLFYSDLILYTSFTIHYNIKGAKDDWDFRISNVVKNPDGTDIQSLW